MLTIPHFPFSSVVIYPSLYVVPRFFISEYFTSIKIVPALFASPTYPSFLINKLFSIPFIALISSYSQSNNFLPFKSINPYFPFCITFSTFFSYHILSFSSIFSSTWIWSYCVNISSFFLFNAFVLYVPSSSFISYVHMNTSFVLSGITIISWYDGFITVSPPWFITPHLSAENAVKYSYSLFSFSLCINTFLIIITTIAITMIAIITANTFW